MPAPPTTPPATTPPPAGFTPAPLATFEGGDPLAVPLLLIHAFPLDHGMWEPQMQGGLHARLVAPDLRGFGASYFDEPASIEGMARDAIAAMDDLEIPRFAVAGVSMGGYIAMAIARLVPDRVLGLVLSDTRAGADTAQAREGRDRTIALVREHGSEHLVETMPRKLLSPRTLEGKPGIVRLVQETIAAASPAGLENALAAMRDRPDATAGLRAARVPTLVLVGEEDTFTTPEEAQRLADLVPGARLVTIPEAGHLPSLENPEAFNAALAQFLTTIAPTGHWVRR